MVGPSRRTYLCIDVRITVGHIYHPTRPRAQAIFAHGPTLDKSPAHRETLHKFLDVLYEGWCVSGLAWPGVIAWAWLGVGVCACMADPW